jgi:hypothetical protein
VGVNREEKESIYITCFTSIVCGFLVPALQESTHFIFLPPDFFSSEKVLTNLFGWLLYMN